AQEALGEIRDSPVTRIPHRPLIGRVWELRDTLTAYDAAYVTLGERMSSGGRRRARVHLAESAGRVRLTEPVPPRGAHVIGASGVKV
ncbi:MAG: hypothetical protein LC799_00270, partial [Actinobacteria bacterium]|nr:hypothetical protein [Actinomycetota bacterium]